MTIPAFQKVQTNSQEMQIKNNLRQLAAGADIYYLENGVNTVTYDKLVGPEKEKYVKSITPVAGEDYTKLQFKEGQPLRVTTADGRTVVLETWQRGPGPEHLQRDAPARPRQSGDGPRRRGPRRNPGHPQLVSKFTANRHRGFGTDMANLGDGRAGVCGQRRESDAPTDSRAAGRPRHRHPARHRDQYAGDRNGGGQVHGPWAGGAAESPKDNVSQQWPGE